ncbi:hypothetical protein, partial [Burkholderia gladioli]|uniref:hypothetical protein n=1 Tax=Burkholderia gladioli TaxID=28095 RepID=UPI002FE32BE9
WSGKPKRIRKPFSQVSTGPKITGQVTSLCGRCLNIIWDGCFLGVSHVRADQTFVWIRREQNVNFFWRAIFHNLLYLVLQDATRGYGKKLIRMPSGCSDFQIA